MVLAVPNINTLRFEKIYKKIFEHLESSTVYTPPMWTRSIECAPSSQSYLPVISHGSYDVVVVPEVADLDRVPPEFTQMDAAFKDAMRAAYASKGYGAVLCKLRPGSKAYEPFAYSHIILENQKLFVPTLHIHRNAAGHFDMNHADWDHEIYSFGTICHIANSEEMHPTKTNKVAWSRLAEQFRFTPNNLVRCLRLTGHGAHPNEDIMLPLSKFEDDEFPIKPFPLYRSL